MVLGRMLYFTHLLFVLTTNYVLSNSSKTKLCFAELDFVTTKQKFHDVIYGRPLKPFFFYFNRWRNLLPDLFQEDVPGERDAADLLGHEPDQAVRRRRRLPQM